MPRIKLSDSELIDLAKEKKATLDAYARGISLQSRSGATLDEIYQKICRDRAALSKLHLESARICRASPAAHHRSAISRAYYSMYHIVRAVVYWTYGGDDHEKHSVLPAHLPDGFPQKALWENELKTARLLRNEADYEIYPRPAILFTAKADTVINSATNLLGVSRSFLRKKGCRIP